ncbi:hypothetical protein [Actinomadura alba]|uniref:Uncharacterized protein n=1 Tax=Actinomadura alba TaxID=406431 RepID=A0ABR7LHV2_9ACTN|nr:hypothetical protein [Actinomadura alba]MBC6464253.1 hypothetical protein [Actinomadura alba]
MYVIYNPTGGDERRWEYKAEDLPSSEAEDIEDATATTFDEFQVALLKGGARARRALLWVLLKRNTPGLRFADVSFRMGELQIEFDSAEKSRLREGVAKAKGLSDSDREMALQLLADEDEGEDPKEDPPEDGGTPA